MLVHSWLRQSHAHLLFIIGILMPGKCPYFKTLLWLILHSIKSFLLLIVLRITNGPLSPHLCPLAILLGSSWLIQRIINILSRATVHALNAEWWNFNGNQIEINPEIWFWRYHLEIQVNSCITAESLVIGIDTKIEVIVVSPTTWEAHHSPRAKPEGCGELPRSLVTPQWPKSRYQFRFYHDAPKYIKFMQIRVCISRKSFIKPLQISHYGKHGHRPLSQQLP